MPPGKSSIFAMRDLRDRRMCNRTDAYEDGTALRQRSGSGQRPAGTPRGVAAPARRLPPGKKQQTSHPSVTKVWAWGVGTVGAGREAQALKGRCAELPCNTHMLISVLGVLVCWFLCCGVFCWVWCPPWVPSASFGWSPLPRSCWSVGRTPCGDMRLLPL